MASARSGYEPRGENGQRGESCLIRLGTGQGKGEMALVRGLAVPHSDSDLWRKSPQLNARVIAR
jgi:hypothetical protein